MVLWSCEGLDFRQALAALAGAGILLFLLLEERAERRRQPSASDRS
jgi:hypothetical protein